MLPVVHWAEYDAPGDTWEPVDNLTNCEEAARGHPRVNMRQQLIRRRALIMIARR